MNTGQKGFFEWVQKRMPRLYADIRREFGDANQLHGLGLTTPDPVTMATTAPMTQTLSQTITDIANVAAQAYLTKQQIDAQNKILKINLQRAQQGLTPLDLNPATYGLPQPSFGVGLTEDTKKMLMWGALGVGGLWVLGMLKPSRR